MARLLIVLGILGLLTQGGFSNKYDNYTLIRFMTSSTDELEAAHQFKDPEDLVEVLKASRGINDTLDVLVPQSRLEFVQKFALDAGLVPEVKKKHYGRTFDDISNRAPRRRVLRGFNVFEYNSYTNILEYLDKLAARHRDVMTIQTLGSSYQGRRMKLVQISSRPDAGNPIILIDAGIHAREWVAPAMAMYLINRLVTDSGARKPGGELDGVDWYIIPVANPDGYEYSRSSRSNRMWRKTRSKNSNCYGVDGNRNYGYKWALSGVSRDPCNKETYAGPTSFSEPETKLIRDVMLSNVKRIKLYVSLHSYGQYLVYPWGYTGDFLPPEWKKLHHLAKAVSDSVQRAGGKPFRVLSAGKWYPAAGGSDDFAFANGVPYSYTMELTDGYEFTFPERLLQGVLPQFYEGFRTFASHIRQEFNRLRRKRSIDDDEYEV